MATNIQPATAKIYQFPQHRTAQGRVSGGRRSCDDLRPAPVPLMDFGAAWYHQAAVEAERPRRN